MTSLRTPADLADYICKHQIEAQLVVSGQETPTVALAAQSMGCPESQIVKSVLFLIKDADQYDTVLVISNGSAPIDRRKLAALFKVGRKRVKLAPPEVVSALTGYPAGGVPPFGYAEPIETFIDVHVLDEPVVYAGGGDERTLVWTTPAELLRVSRGQVIEAR
jgi:prolyl-tRNA editing enzyme YbaK/EbsC (Cys-tRNA(Pro) deacylase)